MREPEDLVGAESGKFDTKDSGLRDKEGGGDLSGPCICFVDFWEVF